MATKITLDGYDSYSGADIVVTAQLSNIDANSAISKKCYILGSLQTISISTYQDKSPVRSIGNINAKDYLMGPRSIAGSLVFAVFDRHFAYNIFNDLKEYTGKATLLTDEIPPLDLTLCFANEYGRKSRMTLYGVRMVSEGQVMSVNDLFTENTYQFVGVGMENLTPEDSNYPSMNPNTKDIDPIISTTQYPFDPNDIIDTGSKYDWKKDEYEETIKTIDPSGITDVKINQPITDEDYGTIIIGINDPNAVETYLINIYEDEESLVLNSDTYGDDTNKWAISVPQGTYSLFCFDKDTNEKLNEIDNVVVKYDKTNESMDDYPLINYVSDSVIEAEINNPEHNQLVLCSDNNIIDKSLAVKNTCAFYNLSPSTEYTLYSNNSQNEEDTSKISICNTLDTKFETENNFKDFVFNNKNLWQNDLSKANYDALNIDNSLNLIDKIMNLDFEYKDELLLYAIIYQNDYLKCANSKNDINLIYNNDVLNPYFTVKNPYNKMIFYYLNNGGYYYGDSKNPESVNKDSIYNRNNKRYYAFAIDNENLKSLKYDFYNFDSNIKETLAKYRKKDVNLNDYNYSDYKNQYPVMDENLLESIIYKDYNVPKYSILNAPKISYDYGKEELYVKFDFTELMDDNKKYYLCICNKNSVFQSEPMIKIEINNSINEMTLNKYKTHILRDNYYMVFIEDENMNIVSSSSILSSYSDTTELSDYNFIYYKNFLNQIKTLLLNTYTCRDLIESVYLTVLSYNLDTKDPLNIFIQELLNEGIDSLQYSSLDSMIFDIFAKIQFKNINNVNTVEYNKGVLSFNNNIKIITLDFYIDEEEPTKQIINNKINTVDLNNRNSYYTLVYGINKFSKMNTGFILKNNVNNKIYCHKLDLTEVK